MNALKKLFKSFYYAFRGVAYCIRDCRNFRTHIVATLFVLAFSRYFEFGATEYAVLFLTFGSVLTAEAFNCALEHACDSVTQEYSEKIKLAKDSAAAAVLICAIFSVGVAVSFFAKPNVIVMIFKDIAASPIKILLFALFFILSVIFIFYKEFFKNGKK